MALITIWLIAQSLLTYTAVAAPESAVCDRWPQPKLALEDTLCVTLRPLDDTIPLYHQRLGGDEFWFRFDDQGLALVVDGQKSLDALANNPARQAALLSVLNKNRLDLWHQDALYWAKWLAESNW